MRADNTATATEIAVGLLDRDRPCLPDVNSVRHESSSFTKGDSLQLTIVDSSSDREDAGSHTATPSPQSDGHQGGSGVGNTSQVVAALQVGSDWVYESWLYQWLTKEPEPEVIVIDLRETYTVGPFIRLLDRVTEAVSPYWEHSRLKATADTLETWGESAADTRVGQLLGKLLAPPDRPERDSEE